MPVIVLTVLLYSITLHAPFVYDDVDSIILNEKLHQLRNLTDVVFSELRQIRVYQNLTFAVDWAISGPGTLSFHVTNLVLHLANVFLVFRYLRKILPERNFVVGLSTFLFAVHPLQIQGVAYVMGRVSSLQALFTFGCLNLLVSENPKLRLLVFPLSALALLAKESCILLPILLLWHELTIGRKTFREIGWKAIAGGFAVMALFIPLQHLLRDQHSMYDGTTGFGIYPYFEYLLTQAYYFLFHLWLVFFSGDQSLLHQYPVFSSKIFILGIFGFLYLAGASVAVAANWRRAPLVAFFAGAYLIVLGPTNTFVEMLNPFAEYRLYQANLSIFVLGSLGLDILIRRANLEKFRTFLTAAIVVGFGAANYAQQRLWEDPVELISRSIEIYPDSYVMNASLAQAYNFRHDLKSMEYYLKEADRLAYLDPYRKTVKISFLLAHYYGRVGRFDEAMHELDLIEKNGPAILGPKLPSVYYVSRLNVLHALGRRADFEAVRAKALALYPPAEIPNW
ncbi:MAG: hypothetical protein JST04_17855 [Bdellovibrionales bacterium]|nr:hypothetical protein [Bdellovibrionales bacterium]